MVLVFNRLWAFRKISWRTAPAGTTVGVMPENEMGLVVELTNVMPPIAK